MVSPLSSRIYNLEAKAKIKNRKHLNNVTHSLPWQLESRTKRISGYTADRESPSVVVNFKKQNRADVTEAFAKKRKIEELNFQAYNVKNDLENAGVDFVPRSKALPEGFIDMSGVTLIKSSEYTGTRNAPQTSDFYESAYELMVGLETMIKSSEEFYKGNGRQHKKRKNNVFIKALSITSSTTYGTSLSSSPCDSEFEEESTPSVLPTIVENPLDIGASATKEYLLSSKDNFATLEEALSSSGIAR